jgi:hypothetical protein
MSSLSIYCIRMYVTSYITSTMGSLNKLDSWGLISRRRAQRLDDPLTAPWSGAPVPLWMVGPCRCTYKGWGAGLHASRGWPCVAAPHQHHYRSRVSVRRREAPLPPPPHTHTPIAMATGSSSSSQGAGNLSLSDLSLSLSDTCQVLTVKEYYRDNLD